MTSNFKQARADAFRSDILLWIVVRHLLTADLLRELGDAVVDAYARTQPGQRERLLDWNLPSAPNHLANVALRLQKTQDKFERYLQDVVLAFVRKDDRPPFVDSDEMLDEERKIASEINAAFELCSVDLATAPQWKVARRKRGIPRQLEPMISCLDLLIRPEPGSKSDYVEEAIAALARISAPSLRAALTKHVGDLCLDSDCPEQARRFYLAAGSIGLKECGEAWGEWRSLLESMLRQSEAACLLLTEGPARADEILRAALSSASFDQDPLLLLNAGTDALNAQLRASDQWPVSTIRAAKVLFAPTLLYSHELGPALSLWRAEEWSEAQRGFWCVLRRQIALGAASDSRGTKALFGQCIVDELTASLGRQLAAEKFRIAIRLLLESGDYKTAARINWTRPLVERYVNADELEWAFSHVSRHPGALHERRLVMVALSQGWLLAAPSDRIELATSLLTFLGGVARDEPWERLLGADLAQQSFEALKIIADKRPDFAPLGGSVVAEAVLRKLGSRNFRACWGALETALEFAESFSDRDLKACISETLEVLALVEPTDANWPVVRPAIGLLSAPCTQQLWAEYPELGVRCADTILRFGLAAGNENVRMLFLLKYLAPYISQGFIGNGRLKEIITDLRRRARQIRSTAAIGPIVALLEVPALSEREGIDDALGGLSEILRSAATGQPSLSLASAYEGLLQLARNRDNLLSALRLTTDEWKRLLEPVMVSLLDAWRAATANPALLTPFAIPQLTTANPTVVHNWTYASLAFAESVGELSRVEEALAAAALNAELNKSIAVARAIRLPANGQPNIEPEAIVNESREPFYAALGQRLVSLRSAMPDKQRTLIAALLVQCLKHGPDGLDAGVFAVAQERGLSFPEVDAVVWKQYEQRLDRTEELKFSLSALLHGLRNPSKSEIAT